MESVVHSWSELRARHAAQISRIDSEISYLILLTRNESVAAANRAEEAAVGKLRSSLCGLEAQAASADAAAASTARAYLALFEREGLTAELGQASEGTSNEGPSQ